MLNPRTVITRAVDADLLDDAFMAMAFFFNQELPEDFVRLWDGRTDAWLHAQEEAELCRSLEEMSVDAQRAAYAAIRRRATEMSNRLYGRQSKWARSFEERLGEVAVHFVHPMTRGQIIRAAMYVEGHLRDELAFQKADDQATRRFEQMAYG